MTRLLGIEAVVRNARRIYYSLALKQLSARDPLHPDVSFLVLKLAQIEGEA